MPHHVNHVVLIGTVLQTWPLGNDRAVRLQVRRPAFFPLRPDGPSDLVNAVLPEAVTRGQIAQEGDELHIEGFIRNADRETLLSSIAKGAGIKLPKDLEGVRVRQIVTEVVAIHWQLVC
jgi:hypothetical protein